MSLLARKPFVPKHYSLFKVKVFSTFMWHGVRDILLDFVHPT
jgi:hypothetical protein